VRERRLWHRVDNTVEIKRYFEPITATTALAALAAAGGTAGVGAGIASMFGLGKKKKTQDQFSYYTSPDYIKLRDSLYGITNTGIPGSEAWGKNYYQNELMPQIREQYETKRNPYGGYLSDSQEYGNIAQAGRGVTSDIGKLNMQAKLDAYKMLSGITGGATTTFEQGTDPNADFLSALTGLGGNLTGSYLGGNMQSNALAKILSGMNDPYENFYNPGQSYRGISDVQTL
jgi:hypothetical protein